VKGQAGEGTSRKRQEAGWWSDKQTDGGTGWWRDRQIEDTPIEGLVTE
jgi:hypothetical protein